MKNTNQPRTPTPAQINANRENARKSTGPRTAEGKAISSRNHLQHGLRANKYIPLDKDLGAFLSLLQDLYSRFQPVGDIEERLVLRIAADQWRLDRTLPMEAGIYRQHLKRAAKQDTCGEGDLLARAFIIDCAGPNALPNLARYECAIERSIDRCLRQLETYRTARAASPAKWPAITV